MKKSIAVVGAAGQQTRVTVKALADRFGTAIDMRLGDRSDAVLDLAEEIPCAQAAIVDIEDGAVLRTFVSGVDLVINGVGPYGVTAKYVRAACLDEQVDYIDLDDDDVSVLEAMALNEIAQARGVRLFVGCGAAPGLDNLMVAALAADLDEVVEVDAGSVIGSRANEEFGRGAILHGMHIFSACYPSIRNGEQVLRRAGDETRVLQHGPALGPFRGYECAKPDALMFKDSYPELVRATYWNGLWPAPLTGMLVGVAQAWSDGRLAEEEAVEFFAAVSGGRRPGWRALGAGLRGLGRRLRARELTVGELWRAVTGKGDDRAHTGLAVRVAGRKADAWIARDLATYDHDAGSALESLEAATGLSLATFTVFALERQCRPGCLFADQWLTLDEFLPVLQDFGDRREAQLLGGVQETAWSPEAISR